MTYRTRTYIAAEWDGDNDAVQQLHKWNNSNYFSLSFTDAHDLQQARDGSLNCSIKRSLAERLDEKAVRDGLKIVVLYNAATVDKSKCPEAVKYVGTHKAMCYYQNGQYYWDYQAVKSALG